MVSQEDRVEIKAEHVSGGTMALGELSQEIVR